MSRQSRWNKEQIFVICDEVKRIKDTIPDGKGGGVPGQPRTTAMTALAKRLGMSSQRRLYDIFNGKSKFARSAVIEWRQARGVGFGANGDSRVVRKPYTRMSADVAELVQKLRAEGLTYPEITRKTGIPEGSLSALIHRRLDDLPQTASPPKNGHHKRGLRATKKGSDLGADFQAFLDAKEEEATLALKARHAVESDDLEQRHLDEDKKLREELAARRTQVIDQLVDFWTRAEAK